jgi:hypothetical protein
MKPANKSNTMSAVAFGIMLIASAAFCAMIGDFAPTAVGAKWVYSYYYLGGNGMSTERDSLTVSITVSSKFMVGQDTIIILDVLEQGRKISNYGGIKDTTGTWNYSDTAIGSGDSVVPWANHAYGINIFPFYKNHVLTQDSLKKVLLGGDSVFYYRQSFVSGGYQCYYQNIGLYSYFNLQLGGFTYSVNVNLISFNNGSISVAAKPSVSKPAARPVISFRHAVIILDGKQMRKGGIYYNIGGKRISAGQHLYHGILIEKIGNP